MGNPCYSTCCFSQNENPIDLTPLTDMVQDVNHLDQLISIIEKRLAAIASQNDRGQQNTPAQQIGSSSQFAPVTNVGKDLVDKMSKRAHSCMVCCKSSFNSETRKVVIDVLKEASQIHSLAAALCVIGYVLQQIDQLSTNRDKCVQLLRHLCAIAKRVKQLDDHLPAEKEELNQAVQLIFKGCLLCLTQMKSQTCSRLSCASVDAGDLQNLESQIKLTYPDLILGAVIDVLQHFHHDLPPTQGEDRNPVGIKEEKDAVIRLLQMDPSDESRRAVVLFGVGGVGKTTLAEAVVNSLDLKGYKFCRLYIDQNCSNDHIKRLQEQILLELFGDKIALKGHWEGQEELTRAFRTSIRPIFMFIDNALTASDLTNLLPPDLSCLPANTRMLLTTTRLDQTNILQPVIQRFEYRVKFLSQSKSKELLCKKALGSANASFPEGVESRDVEEIVKMCGGIPLIIVLVASQLTKCNGNKSIVKSVKESLEESIKEGEGEMSERVVDSVYNRLDEFSREAFLDIVCFFQKKSRRMVGYAVGKKQLQVLEDAALVNVSHQLLTKRWECLSDFTEYLDTKEGIINIHDVIESRGRKLSYLHRFMDLERFIEVVQDTQKLQDIKGIWISGNSQYELQAKYLDSIHSSLRVVNLNSKIQVVGKCLQSFEKLRYLDDSSTCTSSMDLSKMKRLAVMKGKIANNVVQLPPSLRSLSLHNSSHLPTLLERFSILTSVEEMDLSYCDVLEGIPRSFGQLRSLYLLDLHNCSNLVTLPDSFGNLSALQALSLSHCYKLASLPNTFVELKSLCFLDLRNCKALTTVPNSLGGLSSLQVLYLEDCSNLFALPESFGNLCSLKTLYLSWCSNLESLPESFGQLSSLTFLDMDGCKKLSSLPDSFGQLKSLEYLKINLCLRLERLCGDCKGLSSLMAVEASFCNRLEGKAIDVMSKVKNLMFFKMYKSFNLIRRWKQIRQQHALLACHVSYNSDRQMAVTEDLANTINTILFHPESRYLCIESNELVEWSFPHRGETQKDTDVALLLTMCDLSSASNRLALQRVKEELQSMMEESSAHEDLVIIYMDAGDSLEMSEEHIRRRLLLLPSCTRAWITSDDITRRIFNYAVYRTRRESLSYEEGTLSLSLHDIIRQRINYTVYGSRNDSLSYEGEKLSLSFHTHIVTFTLGMDKAGKRKVKWVNRYFPCISDFEGSDGEDRGWQLIRKNKLEAIIDPTGGLEGLFGSLDDAFVKISNYDYYNIFWQNNPDEDSSICGQDDDDY